MPLPTPILRRLSTVSTAAALLLCLGAVLPALEVGDKAPALRSAAWVKNGAVDVGTGVVVVEFWATWCGPCRTSIPHLTKLAQKHAGKIAFAGLSAEEEEVVKPFVTKQGAAMDYHVGVVDEELNRAYMEGHDGIPFAFVVGADGVVLWTGHPMAIDGVLEKVTSGGFDAKAEAARAKRRAELEEMLQEDPGENKDAFLTKVTDKAAAILADDANDETAFQVLVGVAKHREDPAAVRAAFAGLPLDKLSAARAAEIASAMAADENPADRHLDLAWAIAARAVAADAASPAAHAAAARVRYALGLLDEAISEQEQAATRDPDLKDGLVFYREARRLRDLAKAGQPLTAPADLPAPKPVAPVAPVVSKPAAAGGMIP